MENPKNNIKDPKVRAYFEDITEGKEPSVRLSADELEKGINQFDEGMKKVLAEGDEMIIRAKMGEMAKAGKTAAFTESERQQFREALQDLSKRISAIAMTI